LVYRSIFEPKGKSSTEETFNGNEEEGKKEETLGAGEFDSSHEP
jgi:hypothetical protein